ncbi:hypothetical protein BH23BAC2_BH23BAC2_08150 [soil metagenome]
MWDKGTKWHSIEKNYTYFCNKYNRLGSIIFRDWNITGYTGNWE